MNIRLILVILISKVIIKLLRLFNKGGTTLPGKIAKTLYNDVLKSLASQLTIIMVTGTNGKTTTTKIIGQILTENGIEHITNKSGANLVSGITTIFIESATILGKFKVQTTLLEIDEAAFNIICNVLEPDVLVVTNFFRDQLDRYGELYTTLNNVKSGISKHKKTKLILNADDSLCASIGKDSDKQALYFGFSPDAYENSDERINTDATFCIYCKEKYQYTNRVFSHLGGFYCTNCGYTKPTTDITCEEVVELKSAYTVIRFSNSEGSFYAKINLPGLYNVYNALAAISLSQVLGLPINKTINALGSFQSGFGRMETINVESKFIKVILVKNPTGFDQVLSYLLTEENPTVVAFAINDKIADGTDISWLWDVDFEKLCSMKEKLSFVYTSGVRAEDMAVRLKYAGLNSDKINIAKDYNDLINQGLSKTLEKHSFYILPTYTAMLDIRQILQKRFDLKEFWK